MNELYDSIQITPSSKTEEISSELTDPKTTQKFSEIIFPNASTPSKSESEFTEPSSLQEAIINLYLSVKIRKDGEALNKAKVKEEKSHLLPYFILL